MSFLKAICLVVSGVTGKIAYDIFFATTQTIENQNFLIPFIVSFLLFAIGISANAKTLSKESFMQKTPAEFSITEEEVKEIIEILQNGEKIQAIKLYRGKTGAGLRAAKDAIDKMEKDL